MRWICGTMEGVDFLERKVSEEPLDKSKESLAKLEDTKTELKNERIKELVLDLQRHRGRNNEIVYSDSKGKERRVNIHNTILAHMLVAMGLDQEQVEKKSEILALMCSGSLSNPPIGGEAEKKIREEIKEYLTKEKKTIQVLYKESSEEVLKLEFEEIENTLGLLQASFLFRDCTQTALADIMTGVLNPFLGKKNYIYNRIFFYHERQC